MTLFRRAAPATQDTETSMDPEKPGEDRPRADDATDTTASRIPAMAKNSPSFMRPGWDDGQNRHRDMDGRKAGGRRLVVGREISLTGDIGSCDQLVVEGDINATLAESSLLEIAQNGTFRGRATVIRAEISGHFEGELEVRERLKVRKTGSVSGTIRYAELEIEVGGRIAGTLEALAETMSEQPVGED